MPSEDIAISVRNLTKRYRLFGHPGDRVKQFFSLGLKQYHREFTALKDVSFDIRKGETVGIIGRNGSGKSTLLQLICGILKPSVGTIEVDGRVSALLELGAGFNPEFTGRENVYFQGALMGFTEVQMDQRFEAIAAFADIGEFIDQPVRTYSSGMFVRLAFAAAIHVDAEILVVDEALAVGDIAFQAKCTSALNRLSQAGATIVFVSHDLGAIRGLCTRTIWLEQGRVQQIGTAASVTDCYLRELIDTRQASLHTTRYNEFKAANQTLPMDEFRHDDEFIQRTASMRRGSGEAILTAIEMLDEGEQAVIQAQFDMPVSIRMHILFRLACELSISYYIRDDKHQILFGSTTQLEGYGLVSGTTGARKIVEFRTRLPLAEGNYNVLAVLSIPRRPNQTADFVDYVDNALVFTVEQRLPIRLWSKMYLPNSLTVHDV